MKTNLHKIIGADPELMESGVWEDICPGVRVKIGSADSRNYLRAFRNAVVNSGVTPKDKLEGEVFEQILREAAAEALVLDWEGIVDEEGNPVPCNKENALELLGDKDLHIFTDRVLFKSQNLAAFRRERRDEEAKNS